VRVFAHGSSSTMLHSESEAGDWWKGRGTVVCHHYEKTSTSATSFLQTYWLKTEQKPANITKRVTSVHPRSFVWYNQLLYS
jgi:hypothetical protein